MQKSQAYIMHVIWLRVVLISLEYLFDFCFLGKVQYLMRTQFKHQNPVAMNATKWFHQQNSPFSGDCRVCKTVCLNAACFEKKKIIMIVLHMVDEIEVF